MKQFTSDYNFPDTKQATDWTCGAACAVGILNYYDISVKEEQVRKILGSNENDGTPVENIKKLFDYEGISYSYKENIILEEFKEELQKGKFALVLIQAWADNQKEYLKDTMKYGHYVIVLDYKDGYFIIEDPIIFGRGKIKETQFDIRWKDKDNNGKIYNHMALYFDENPKYYLKIQDIV